jgi:hypothetical protein
MGLKETVIFVVVAALAIAAFIKFRKRQIGKGRPPVDNGTRPGEDGPRPREMSGD